MAVKSRIWLSAQLKMHCRAEIQLVFINLPIVLGFFSFLIWKYCVLVQVFLLFDHTSHFFSALHCFHLLHPVLFWWSFLLSVICSFASSPFTCLTFTGAHLCLVAWLVPSVHTALSLAVLQSVSPAFHQLFKSLSLARALECGFPYFLPCILLSHVIILKRIFTLW